MTWTRRSRGRQLDATLDAIMSGCGPIGSTSLASRGRAAHWLIAGLWLALAWLTLTPAQAALLTRAETASGFTVQRGLAPRDLPRRLEADLPDLLDTAHPAEIDSDGAVPRRIAATLVVIPAPHASPLRAATVAAPARAFDPRAPPSLR